MKNRITKNIIPSLIKTSYLEEYNCVRIKSIQDYKDAVPENIYSIGDTTETTRSYAYGQGCSIFVKLAERKRKH